MQITAILFGTYAKILPPSCRGRTSVDVPAGSTVADVLDALDVPAYARTFLSLNGERVTPEDPVDDGAELRVIVPLAGG